MSTIYITGVADGARTPVVRAIRDALDVLGWKANIGAALDVIAAVEADGEVRLFEHDDEELIDRAAAILNAAGVDTEVRDDDSDSELPAEWKPSADAPPPSVGHDSALILMHLCEGNPNYALTIARSLKRVSGDDTWDRVADVLLSVFPARPA